MQSMTQGNTAERRRKVNNEIQKIRDEFLAQACRYLFGPAADCGAFHRLGMPALQPIPVSCQTRQR